MRPVDPLSLYPELQPAAVPAAPAPAAPPMPTFPQFAKHRLTQLGYTDPASTQTFVESQDFDSLFQEYVRDVSSGTLAQVYGTTQADIANRAMSEWMQFGRNNAIQAILGNMPSTQAPPEQINQQTRDDFGVLDMAGNVARSALQTTGSMVGGLVGLASPTAGAAVENFSEGLFANSPEVKAARDETYRRAIEAYDAGDYGTALRTLASDKIVASELAGMGLSFAVPGAVLKVLGRIKATGAVGQALSNNAGTATAVMGGVSIPGMAGNEAYQRAVQAGATPEQATALARSAQTDPMALAAGAVGMVPVAEKVMNLPRQVMRGNALINAGKVGLLKAPIEAGQEAFEEYGEASAVQNALMSGGPQFQEQVADVRPGFNALIGAAAGGAAGGIAGGVQGYMSTGPQATAPGAVPPGQTSPDQTPPGQTSPDQTPPGQTPPGAPGTQPEEPITGQTAASEAQGEAAPKTLDELVNTIVANDPVTSSDPIRAAAFKSAKRNQVNFEVASAVQELNEFAQIYNNLKLDSTGVSEPIDAESLLLQSFVPGAIRTTQILQKARVAAKDKLAEAARNIDPGMITPEDIVLLGRALDTPQLATPVATDPELRKAQLVAIADSYERSRRDVDNTTNAVRSDVLRSRPTEPAPAFTNDVSGLPPRTRSTPQPIAQATPQQATPQQATPQQATPQQATPQPTAQATPQATAQAAPQPEPTAVDSTLATALQDYESNLTKMLPTPADLTADGVSAWTKNAVKVSDVTNKKSGFSAKVRFAMLNNAAAYNAARDRIIRDFATRNGVGATELNAAIATHMPASPAPEGENSSRPSFQSSSTENEWLSKHVESTGGDVVWTSGQLALLRVYGRDGTIEYRGVNGNTRTLVDIREYLNEDGLFSSAALTMLKSMAIDLDIQEAVAVGANPQGPFADGDLAFSEDVPASLRGVAEGWKRLLALNNIKLVITSLDGARSLGNTYPGKYRILSRASRYVESNAGLMQAIDRNNGEYHIALSFNRPERAILETLAHEMGHILELSTFEQAPAETKSAIKAAYWKWYSTVKKPGTTARDLIDNLRAYETARNTIGAPGTLAKDLDPYWTGFPEWFAEQVSKWATSDKAPLSVVDRFFKKLADILRNFFVGEHAKFLPDANVAEWLNSLGTNPVSRKNWVDSLSETQAAGDIRFSRIDTGSPEFRAWFGDSKVVDENGNPLVVYHGTPKVFTAFEDDRIYRINNLHYFSDDPAVATEYAEKGGPAAWASANIMPAYVALKNPVVFDAKQHHWHSLPLDFFPKEISQFFPDYVKLYTPLGERSRKIALIGLTDVARAAIKAGYDGVIANNIVDGNGPYGNTNARKVVIATRPDQIKSATGNVGAYGQRPITEAEAAPLGMTAAEANRAQAAGDIRFSKTVVEGEAQDTSRADAIINKLRNPTGPNEFSRQDTSRLAKFWEKTAAEFLPARKVDEIMRKLGFNTRFENTFGDFKAKTAGTVAVQSEKVLRPLEEAIEQLHIKSTYKNNKDFLDRLGSMLWALHGIERNRMLSARNTDLSVDGQQIRDALIEAYEKEGAMTAEEFRTQLFNIADRYAIDANWANENYSGARSEDLRIVFDALGKEIGLTMQDVAQLKPVLKAVADQIKENIYASNISPEQRRRFDSYSFEWWVPLRATRDVKNAVDEPDSDETLPTTGNVIPMKGRNTPPENPLMNLERVFAQSIKQMQFTKMMNELGPQMMGLADELNLEVDMRDTSADFPMGQSLYREDKKYKLLWRRDDGTAVIFDIGNNDSLNQAFINTQYRAPNEFLMTFMAPLTRWYSRAQTWAYPVFMLVTQALRDFNYAPTMLAVDHGMGKSVEFITEYVSNGGYFRFLPLALKGAFASPQKMREFAKAGDKAAQDIVAFEDAGGASQFADFYGVMSSFAAELNANPRLARLKSNRLVRTGYKATDVAASVLDSMGTMAEYGARIATFNVLRNQLGDQEAATYARNLQNFTQSGSEAANYASLVPFWRAAMTGADRIYMAIRKPTGGIDKRKLGTMLGMGATMGFLWMALLDGALGEDDDGEPVLAKMRAETALMNLILPIEAGEGEFYRVPLGYGLPQLLPALGTLGYMVAQGYVTREEATYAIIDHVQKNTTPIQPYTIPEQADINDLLKGQILGIAGSNPVSDTVVALAANRPRFGIGSIYNEYKEQGVPWFDAPKLGTPSEFTSLSKWFYDTLGVDVPPEVFQYGIDSWLGGIGRSITMVMKEEARNEQLVGDVENFIEQRTGGVGADLASLGKAVTNAVTARDLTFADNMEFNALRRRLNTYSFEVKQAERDGVVNRLPERTRRLAEMDERIDKLNRDFNRKAKEIRDNRLMSDEAKRARMVALTNRYRADRDRLMRQASMLLE